MIIKAFKNIVKAKLYRPRGIIMGADSLILRPHWLHNHQQIEIGARTTIGRFSVLNPLIGQNAQQYRGSIRIGSDVYIGGFCQIHAMGSLAIGDGAVLSEHVYLSDTAHGLNPLKGPIMAQPIESKGPVTIGRNVFIGYGAAVLPGVTLGDHCIVGARSVVTRSFPAYTMVAGSPARRVKIFDVATEQWIASPD